MPPDSPDPAPPASPAQPSAPKYRPKGKIAWLPTPVRDKINQLLLDGLSFPAILKALGPDGAGLSVNNLWRYHKGPYRAWLREQHWLANARAKQESAAELFRGIDSSSVNQAAVQTAILQIYEAVRDVNSGDLRRMLAADPRSYARIVNSLSRLSKENLNLQKYRDACAKAVAAELTRLDPNREFSDREHEILARRADEFFKKPRRRSPNTSPPTTDGPEPSARP